MAILRFKPPFPLSHKIRCATLIELLTWFLLNQPQAEGPPFSLIFLCGFTDTADNGGDIDPQAVLRDNALTNRLMNPCIENPDFNSGQIAMNFL